MMTSGFGDRDVVIDDGPADVFYDDAHVAGVWWDICGTNLHTSDDAETLARELLTRQTLPDEEAPGALSTWWGPPLRTEQFSDGDLRVDFQAPSGRARVVWQATGEIGAEPDFTATADPVTVMQSSGEPPITIDGVQARATVSAAILAIREYVDTRDRPTCLLWAAPLGV
ncbi:MAG: hypothetical protein WCA46_19760 [Actinocatenispora sp.]